MPDVLLTVHCSAADADALVAALRQVSPAPIHQRTETVHGRDFSDAATAEQVTATLRRTAIELIEDAGRMAPLVSAIEGAIRRAPVRWHQVPVLARGRFA